MAEDWAVDVKKYVPDADDATIAGIVRYCGIALTKRDSSLVSFSDAKETARVRDGYCRKKLALTDSDDVVDAAIAKVGERMAADRTKNRVTVYYLLAEHFGKLGIFAGKAAASGTAAPLAAAALAAGAASAGAAATKAPRKAAAKPAGPVAADETTAAATLMAAAAPAMAESPAAVAPPVALAPVAAAPAASAASTAPAAMAVVAPRAAPLTPAARSAAASGDGGGFLGFAAAVFAGLVVLVFCVMLLGNYIGARSDAPPVAVTAAPAVAPAPSAPVPPVIPEGSGIVAETVAGMPKVSVYFDSGSTAISPDFTAAVVPVKAWADANPAARFAVSGFNDPTGNAAANAELSKNRAQAVAAALAEQGVPADRIDLVKPADTTATDADMAQARRVEIVVVPGV